MNGQPKATWHRRRNLAYREAFERLDAALAKNAPPDNAEMIRLLRLAMFGDVDEAGRSGTAKLPE